MTTIAPYFFGQLQGNEFHQWSTFHSGSIAAFFRMVSSCHGFWASGLKGFIACWLLLPELPALSDEQST
jgi:hypothetical protein